MKETHKGLRAGTIQMLNLPVRGDKKKNKDPQGTYFKIIIPIVRLVLDHPQFVSCVLLLHWTEELSICCVHFPLCTFLIHPVEPQLALFIGPAAVNQA